MNFHSFSSYFIIYFYLIFNSAGIGRTGTFIAVDCLMQEATTSNAVNVFSTVTRLRLYRNQMVQNLVRLKLNLVNVDI